MAVGVKICGLSDEAGVSAAVDGGAAMVGFVFFPPSPRSVTVERAAELTKTVPGGILRVGLVVDADDDGRSVAHPLDVDVDAARFDIGPAHSKSSSTNSPRGSKPRRS